jgi:hypothetical protein
MMTIRVVRAMRRGCGDLVPGGFYAQASTSRQGTLKAWTWTLGTMIDHPDALNLMLKPPPRAQLIINVPASLATGCIVSEPTRAPEESDYPGLQHVPRMGLIDHVGSAHYTPMGFVHEIERLGVSRRITLDIARAIEPWLPIPILFTHSRLPLLREEDVPVAESLAWQGLIPPPRSHYGPSFELDPRSTIPHWAIQVIRWVSGEPIDMWPDRATFREDCIDWQWTEQAFGMSWITNVVYVLRRDDPPGLPRELASIGIETIQVADG